MGSDVVSGLYRDHYVRVYRTSSETDMQAVVIHYVDADGKLQSVTAVLSGTEYSAAVPMGVNVVDIELIAPNDLSSVKLVPGMADFVRKEYTVKDAALTGEETTFDLFVEAMDGTQGEYTLVIYREDNSLSEVLVDGVAATERTAVRDGKTVKLYEALASNPDLADIYLRASSNQNTVFAGRVGSVTAGVGSVWSVVDYKLQPYDATTPVTYTELEIQVRTPSGKVETSYLRIYQADSNTNLVETGMVITYEDDLGQIHTTPVYRHTQEHRYLAALPSTAVWAELTVETEHPMASIHIGSNPDRQGTDTRRFTLEELQQALASGQLSTTVTVTSSDGSAKDTYPVDIRMVDLGLSLVEVVESGTDKPGALTRDDQMVDGVYRRYYEALVGGVEFDPTLTLDLNITAADRGASMTINVNGTDYPLSPFQQWSWSYASFPMAPDALYIKSVVSNLEQLDLGGGVQVPVAFTADYYAYIFRRSAEAIPSRPSSSPTGEP